MNAYEMFLDIRENIGEPDGQDAHWDDLEILRKINQAQAKAYKLISQTVGDWFVKVATVTPVASIITLPVDCAKPVYLEHVSTGNEIPFSTTVRERRSTRLTTLGLDAVRDAYLLEGTIEVNESGFTDQCYLWYERRVPKLHCGTAAAGGATSLTLEASKEASLVNDYYNGLYIEAVSGTGAGTRTTISDYVGSTRVCTTAAGTFSTDTVYGIVSVLPEEAEEFMLLDATCALLSKPNSSIDVERVKLFFNLRREAKSEFEEWASVRLKNSMMPRRRNG